jgi:hypothetical protein
LVLTSSEDTVMRKRLIAGADAAEVQYKRPDGAKAKALWTDVDASKFVDGMPWRTFPWYLGQRNYAGTYWCATERRLVNYESRLELSRLVMKDFDPTVRRIASQPFRLLAHIDGARLTRVPDFLAITDAGPLVVDVKRAEELRKPEVEGLLALTRKVVENRGWRYEIATEPPDVVYANIQFLAGYRRDWLFRADVLAEVRGALDRSAPAFLRIILADAGLPKATALPALMHLMWRGECTGDLTRTLTGATAVSSRS